MKISKEYTKQEKKWLNKRVKYYLLNALKRINKKQLLDLQFDKYGYNFCEKCGKEFSVGELDLHHNIMMSKDHAEADNMSHQILVCKKCHIREGC